MVQPSSAPGNRWWGDFFLEEGQAVRWRIGALELTIERLAREWRIAGVPATTEPEANGDGTHWSVDREAAGRPIDEHTERYAFRSTSAALRLTPALADRPVVSQPTIPFYVPSQEEATIFVSSPLWLRVEVGHPPKLLHDAPLQRPSDTWFGPSTLEGELCYSSRTHNRLRLEEVPLYPDRAVTPVRIRNEATNALLLERLNLPVPFLSLFATDAAALWTPTVTMLREHDGTSASLKVDEGPPHHARQAREVAPARHAPGKRVLVRALGALFG